jgi:hypothetical protein
MGSERISRAIKRGMDIVGSTMALVLLSPLFIVISVWIKLTSKGPILFREERVGQYSRCFTFLKFRSKDDHRVTRVGRVLRKTSLDELPQFINVLKGDMSLVGPPPPFPSEFQSYDLEAKPGIAGLWHNAYWLKPLGIVALLFLLALVVFPSPGPRQVISTPLPQDQRSARRQYDRTHPAADRFRLAQPHRAPIAVETHLGSKRALPELWEITKFSLDAWTRATLEAN